MNKNQSYKKQDKTSGRIWNKETEEYVDADWFNDQYSKLEIKSCIACQVPYESPRIDTNGIVTSTLTADRINNNLPHTKSNCRLLCINCNRTRGNRY